MNTGVALFVTIRAIFVFSIGVEGLFFQMIR